SFLIRPWRKAPFEPRKKARKDHQRSGDTGTRICILPCPFRHGAPFSLQPRPSEARQYKEKASQGKGQDKGPEKIRPGYPSLDSKPSQGITLAPCRGLGPIVQKPGKPR